MGEFKTVPVLRGFTEIRELWNLCLRHGGMILGGYARYCASPAYNPVKAADADIYFESQENFDSFGRELLGYGFEMHHENEMCQTFRVPKEDKESKVRHWPTPQLIKPQREGQVVAMGTTEEILSNFDFTVVRAAIISEMECLVDEDFLEDEKAKVLKIKNIHCPISSLLRCIKYVKKGYWFPPSQAVKLFVDWESRGQGYRVRVVDLFEKSLKDDLSEKEVNELEALLRIID